MSAAATHLPIGVFDSGVGGLTVLKALREQLPEEDLVYLGDTARLPYGTKSSQTITRYAQQATEKLVTQNIKALVIACNTATAAALPVLIQHYPHLPVVGVIEPGAQAACIQSASGHIAVIGTESTIRNKAYEREILRLRPTAQVTSLACSLFVSLAEEGWLEGPIVEAVAAQYLHPLFQRAQDNKPDCLVLGCTHFPLLSTAIRHVLGAEVSIVDSAITTARQVQKVLHEKSLHNTSGKAGQVRYLTTDDVARFSRTAGIFLGTPLNEEDVSLVDL